MTTLSLASGAAVELLVDGTSPDLLLYHHGTPAAGPTDPELLRAAHAAGFRVAQVVRPGYGDSTRRLGRTVADNAELSAAAADLLGAETFVSLGWSGGGPHALADAALLPGRCVGALSFAGVAPFDAAGLDFLNGMGQDNVEEFGAVLAGHDALSAFLLAAAEGLVDVRGAEVIEQMRSLLPPADQAFLSGEVADHFATELRFSVANGIGGWFDDDVAFMLPWGFDLGSITVPTFVWQGADDLMVPAAHGRWLGDNVAGTTATVLDGHGHLSLAATSFDQCMAQLRGALNG